MKNVIPAILLSVFYTATFAQGPTYTSSDFGVAGDSLYYSHVATDSIHNLNYALAGANVSWNFSTLNPTDQSTDNYLNPTTAGYERVFLAECLAGGRGFPACTNSFNTLTNLAFRNLGNFQVSTIVFGNVVDHDYLSDNSLTTNILGLTAQVGGVPLPFTTTYIQPDVVRVFPIAYGNADSSVSSYDINLTPYGLNFIYHAHARRVNHVDAWGSLTTTYATYASTVREYSVVVHNDTAVYNGARVSIPTYTTFEYAWFDPAYIGPVFTASGNLVNNQKIFTDISYVDAPICLTPIAAERHEPFQPVITVPGNITVNFTNFSTNANAYTWNFGDPASGIANSTNAANPIHTYRDSGQYNLSLIACNTICIPERCDTLNFAIYVRDSGQVRANFIAEPFTVCTDQRVNFENLSTNASTYFWNFGDLNASTTKNPTHTYTTAGTYQVTLIAYNGNSSDTARRTVTVQGPPSPVIHASGPTTFCSGNTVILYASGGTIYHWSTGQVGSSIYVGRSGTYAVTATNSCGTAVSTPITVTVNVPVDTLVALGDTILCSGDSVRLQANTGDGLVYKWRRDGQILEGVTTNYYDANSSGGYTVNVTENGCTGVSNIIPVIVIPAINAAITAAGSTNICTGSSLILNATPTGVGATYQWQLNGQPIPGATAAIYSATLGGTYTAVISRGKCASTSNSIITTSNITPSPTITYQGNGSICSGDSSYFTTGAGNGYTYQWQKNNEAISGATSAYYYASTAGNYDVAVTANGCSGTSQGVTLKVNPSPLADAGANQNLVACGFATVSIGGNPTASEGTSPYSILWTPSSGLNDSSVQNPTVSHLGSTTLYRVKVTDANGCTATDSATVNVTGSTLSAGITAVGDTSWCTGSGGSVTLTVIPSLNASYTYNWYPSTGLSSTNVATTIASPTASGTYNYTALITDPNGCQASAGVTVQVIAVPAAIVTALDTTVPCQGDSVHLFASPGPGYAYQWLSSSEPIEGSTNINFATASEGSYSVSVTSGICSATSNALVVSVRPNPVAAINISGNISICTGSSYALQATAGDSYTFQWYENDYGVAGATTTIYNATDSASYYYIVGLNGCFEQSDSVVITVNPYPADSVSINGPSQYCIGQVTTLSASTGNGYTYQWLQSGQTIPNENSSSIGVDSSGIYSVAVTALGCTSSSTGVDITVYPYPIATITSQSSVNFCQGDSVTLSALTGTGYNYQWQLDGDTIDGALDSNFVANDTGNYNVVVTQNGCSASSNSLYVNVLPLPFSFATVADNGLLCKAGGSSLVIYGSVGTNYVYQWQVAGSNLPDTADSLVVSAPGIYDVIISAAGCVAPSNNVLISFDTLPTITQNGNTLMASGGLNYQWYQDSTTLITEATGQIFAPTSQGSYNVVVTDTIGCTQESLSFNFIPLGVNTIAGTVHISMYPNPARDAVNIVLNCLSTGNITLKLFDLSGREAKNVYEGKSVAGDNYYVVPLSSLPQGVYMLSIYDGQTTITQKLVKE